MTLSHLEERKDETELVLQRDQGLHDLWLAHTQFVCDY